MNALDTSNVIGDFLKRMARFDSGYLPYLNKEAIEMILQDHRSIAVMDGGGIKAPMIVIEGADGVGKTTLIEELVYGMDRAGAPVSMLSPAAPITPYGAAAYAMAKTGQMKKETAEFFARDRQGSMGILSDARREGGKDAPAMTVIADRYALSTIVYQHDVDMAASAASVLSMHLYVERPSITFFLDVPDDVAKERLGNRLVLDPVEKAEERKHRAERYRELAANIQQRPEWRALLEPITGEFVAVPQEVCLASTHEQTIWIARALQARGLLSMTGQMPAPHISEQEFVTAFGQVNTKANASNLEGGDEPQSNEVFEEARVGIPEALRQARENKTSDRHRVGAAHQAGAVVGHLPCVGDRRGWRNP